jgi:hypothetical protein
MNLFKDFVRWNGVLYISSCRNACACSSVQWIIVWISDGKSWIFYNELPNSSQQSLSGDRISIQVPKKLPGILCEPMFYYIGYNIPPQVPVLTCVNSAQSLPFYLFGIQLSVQPLCHKIFKVVSFSQVSQPKRVYITPVPHTHKMVPHLIFLDSGFTVNPVSTQECLRDYSQFIRLFTTDMKNIS